MIAILFSRSVGSKSQIGFSFPIMRQRSLLFRIPSNDAPPYFTVGIATVDR
jgi:hypothetical protein